MPRSDIPIADIHMHVIPMVDDGSESLEMSMEMLRSSYEQGVRRIFCTPHGGVFFSEDRKNAQLYFEELSQLSEAAYPELELYFGAEVRMLPGQMDLILDMLDVGIMPTLADTEYVLAEYMNFFMDYEDIHSSLQLLIRAGYVPIVAHVERYFSVIPDIAAAKVLHDLGCYFQINAYSIMEDSQEAIRRRARELLDAGLVDFIGSDAHRTTYRPPSLSKGIAYMYQNYDRSYVDRIVYKNVADLILME